MPVLENAQIPRLLSLPAVTFVAAGQGFQELEAHFDDRPDHHRAGSGDTDGADLPSAQLRHDTPGVDSPLVRRPVVEGHDPAARGSRVAYRLYRESRLAGSM